MAEFTLVIYHLLISFLSQNFGRNIVSFIDHKMQKIEAYASTVTFVKITYKGHLRTVGNKSLETPNKKYQFTTSKNTNLYAGGVIFSTPVRASCIHQFIPRKPVSSYPAWWDDDDDDGLYLLCPQIILKIITHSREFNTSCAWSLKGI